MRNAFDRFALGVRDRRGPLRIGEHRPSRRDHAGIDAGPVQSAEDARVLDFHAAIHDDVEPRRKEVGHLAVFMRDLGSPAGTVGVGVTRWEVDPGKWSTPVSALRRWK